MEVKSHNFKGAKVHQILHDGTDVVVNISNEGKLDVWVENIFDVWDKALDEIIEERLGDIYEMDRVIKCSKVCYRIDRRPI